MQEDSSPDRPDFNAYSGVDVVNSRRFVIRFGPQDLPILATAAIGAAAITIMALKGVGTWLPYLATLILVALISLALVVKSAVKNAKNREERKKGQAQPGDQPGGEGQNRRIEEIERC